ncbi:MAG: DUF1877 family protein [Bacteroidales bacterium]
MELQAIYIRVDDDMLDSLKELDGDDLVDAIEEIKEEEDADYIDISTFWDGLHFLITGVSAYEPIPNSLLSGFVVGVDVFSDDDDSDFIGYSTSDEIEEMRKAISKIDIEELKEEFDPRLFHEKNIYPDIWKKKKKEELWNELEKAFLALKNFYSKNRDYNVVVSIY